MTTVNSAGQQLQGIIAKVKTGLTSQQRLTIREELGAFMTALPFLPEYETIRQTANNVSLKLKRQITQNTLDDLESRNAALASHVSAMNAIRQEGVANAKSLKLEAVLAVTDSVTEIVTAARSVRALIDADKLVEASVDIEKIIDITSDLISKMNAIKAPDA